MNDDKQVRQQAQIEQYFKMWLDRDFSLLSTILAPDCHYQECYGPAYLSLEEIQAWIAHQMTVQTVTAWPIEQMWTATDDTIFVRWTFTAVTTSTTHFDGISSVHFNSAGFIDDLREYQSQAAHYYPYHHE